jgi:hypothetical protein
MILKPGEYISLEFIHIADSGLLISGRPGCIGRPTPWQGDLPDCAGQQIKSELIQKFTIELFSALFSQAETVADTRSRVFLAIYGYAQFPAEMFVRKAG